ncbi:MAG: hypothetical protein FJ148_19565 [Deltaproteobacteria bacterium]|nr:hypothetical protein [Deltaproteobacteria bacterium]
MNKRSFLVSFGIVVAVFSLFALWMTRAPTSLIGAAMGVAIAVTALPHWRNPLAWKASIALTAVLLVQALMRLYRNQSAEPDFGTFFFGTVAAMSLTSLLIVLSGGRSGALHSPPGEATDPSRLSETEDGFVER